MKIQRVHRDGRAEPDTKMKVNAKKERLEFKLITKLHADDAGTHTICLKFAVALHARLGRDF